MKDNKEETKKEEKTEEAKENENKENNPENQNADIGNNEEKQEKQNEENKSELNTNKRESKSKSNPFNSPIKYENIYNEEIMKEILENKENRKDIITKLYGELFKSRGERMKSNQMKAIINFHVQSIDFILDKFKSYPIDILTKLANIFSLLLNLKEDEYNLQLKTIDPNSEDPYKALQEPDFGYIINKKIMEIKSCFSKLKLFPDHKNRPEPKEKNFYLTNKELNIILNYLNQCYFPLIRLFYHVINLNRIETKKIHSMMNKPLAIPNNDDIDSAPEKFIIEEQVKRPMSKEKNIDEKIYENLANKYSGLNEKDIKLASEVANKQITSAGIKGDYAAEVRKLITEKVDELRKDVDAKISENESEMEKNIQNLKEQYLPPAKKK
jgi:hypothetical protein